jgi:hypothetical protein
MQSFDEGRQCIGARVAVQGVCMSTVIGANGAVSASIWLDCAIAPDGG